MKDLVSVLCGLCLVFAFQASAPAQTITIQPQSITINNASTATFTVGASNASIYQWQFNGANLSDGGNITGSTNATLMLEDVTSNQAGSYSVVVNNSVTSSNAVLTIVPGTVVRFTFSGIIGGGSNVVDVQLFDHDKPATVENFIHYITSGAFTNMFFERCVPGFVLQGGDFGASNRTDTNPPIYGWDIRTEFTLATNQNPPFPAQVDSEFGIGPLIKNDFGTIAMALGASSNSATSGFYFNLIDNSSTLDGLYGDFTVFGRILDGTNVLQYFNTLTNGGVATNGEFLDNGVLNTNQPFPNLPVNYTGSNAPANSNLVFCDFSFPGGAPAVNTNPPTVAITSAAAPAVLTNSLQGTAGDSVALAAVICAVTPQAATDGTYPYPYTNGATVTNYAVGTSNWALSLNPGSYNVSVQSQNGAGYLSPATNQAVTFTGVLIDGDGTVTLSVGSNVVTTNPVGYPLQQGTSYKWEAKPARGQTFAYWTYNDYTLTNSTVYFGYSGGGILIATFVSTNAPRGTKGISFTYPPANAKLATNSFFLRGKIAPSVKSAQITCQIFSTNTGLVAAGPLTTTGTNTWSIAVSNLPPDTYTVQAVATNTEGFSTVISEEFSVLDFKGVVGTYTGLFLCFSGAPVAPTNSGFFALTVTPSGAFTSRLVFPAYGTVVIEGKFDIYGNAGTYTLNYPKNPVYLYGLSLDLTGGTDELNGYVYSTNNAWFSQLICYRAVTKLSDNTTPAIGKYTVSLEPTNWPNTNGYAALSIDSGGSVALSGMLPDGASFSQSARVSKSGVWPLYVIPAGYKTKGMLMGWETNQASGSIDGQLYWYKGPDLGAYFTDGVNTNVSSTGTNYLPPAAGNYSIVFQGGTISAPVTNALTVVENGGQFKPVNPTNKLAVSLSANGVLTGHFVNAGETTPLRFKGAFFGQSQGGSGFILEGGGRTGYFSLLPP